MKNIQTNLERQLLERNELECKHIIVHISQNPIYIAIIEIAILEVAWRGAK